ncbi:MAG: hypothetical protein LBP76_03045 [Treponema sp.]|jgi:cbb3-type cytochrome oxidase subunit 3|nr:hypothetical protein [Treponema sp.]
MLFFLVPLSVVILTGIIYFAVSLKSETAVRRTAIIALIVIGLAVIASLIVIFSEPVKATGSGIPGFPAVPVKPVKTNSPWVLLFSIIFLIFIALILFIAFRQQKKLENEKAKKTHNADDDSGDLDLPWERK